MTNTNINYNQLNQKINNNFDTFHTTIPNVKLYYPEPFVASPTFMHDDIWFLHIVVYQYWLWFFFIFLIVFFFITFLSTLRWSNLRARPSRETRGVSRSKCGDLITATVPVSWATSIIIHESTDAIEFSDGFGTTEMAVGIRAYQWGWEYYYPKDSSLTLRSFENNNVVGDNSLKPSSSFGDSKSAAKFKLELSLANSSTTFNTSSVNHSIISDSLNQTVTNAAEVLASVKINTDIIPTIRTPKLENLGDFIYDLNNYSSSTGLSSFDKTWENLPLTLLVQSRPSFPNYSFNYLTRMSSFSHILNYDNFNFITCNTNWKSFFADNRGASFVMYCLDYLNNFMLQKVINSSHQSEYGLVNTTYVVSSSIFRPLVVLNVGALSTRPVNIEFIKLYLTSINNFFINASQDFKRWAVQDLIEDLTWSQFLPIPSDFEDYLFDNKVGSFVRISNPSTAAYLNNSKFVFSRWSSTINLDLTTLGFVGNVLNSSFIESKLMLINSFKSFDYLKSMFSFSLLKSFFFFNYNCSNKFNIFGNNFNYLSSSSLYEVLSTFSSNDNTLSYYNLGAFSVNSVQSLPSAGSFLVAAKNLNTYSQAFQKVFKSVVEEERSSSVFRNLSSSYSPTPLISFSFPPLLNSLTKNSSLFTATTVFYPQISTRRFDFSSLNQISNISSVIFPFNVSSQSDIIRYLWFDWYSIRSHISSKAMDTSSFGLHGAKYLSKNFTNLQPQIINQVDNFFNKYNHARKFYIPMSTYSPLLFSKHFIQRLSLESSTTSPDNNSVFLSLLKYKSTCFESMQWSKIQSKSIQTSMLFFGSFDQSVTKNLTKNFNLRIDKVTSLSHLSNVLSLREFTLRKLTGSSTQNLLLTGIYNKTLLDHNKTLLVFKSSNKYSTNAMSRIKSQYQPLRKGITNMIRIQSDKAIAMPIETRLQILAVSKDIIHSWSIPSAGIKIDCIPGYSSHRVATFFIAGIYWGQCMEICGRFHHWMPIVVYFMKRDIFCLWCTHFVLSPDLHTSNNDFSYLPASMFQNIGIYANLAGWVYES